MANEFKISSKIDLKTQEATTLWNKFKSDTEKLKTIDIKVKLNGLDTVSKDLTNLLELANKVSQAQAKMNTSTKANSGTKEDLKNLKEYKDVYRTIQKLKTQKSKGLNDSSLESTNRQITELTSKLTTLQAKMSGTAVDSRRIEFVNSQDLANLARTEKSLSDISSKADKLQSSFKGIDFKNVDTSRTEASINKILTDIEDLQRRATTGVDLTVDLGNAYNELSRLTSEMDKLKQVEDIRGKFEGLENSMRDAFGTEYVERLRSEIEQLENSVLETDDSFDRLSSSIRSSMSSASSDITRMNSEIGQSSRFMSDFAGSFMMFSAGNILGDGIVKSIRGMTQGFLELERSITEVKKVADSVDIDSTLELDKIKNDAIDIAKTVGMASSEVINGIASALKAGANSMQEATEIAKSSLMLANVGDMSGEDATSAVNTMINGFKLNPLKEVQKEMNGTVIKTNELTESMDMLNHVG